MSDLHLEFRDWDHEYPEGDVLILAGDITLAAAFDGEHDKLLDRTLRFFNACRKRFKNIIYVPGNHEYYGSHLETADGKLSDFLEYVDILNGMESVTINGVVFSGGTLWTAYPNERNAYLCKHLMNDFPCIGGSSIEAFQEIHKETVEKILRVKPDVVVTHHCPSFRCINDKYKHQYALNDAYATDLEDLIREISPKFWICGHTHVNKTIGVHNTLILMNSRGYPHEGLKFRPSAMFEIERKQPA